MPIPMILDTDIGADIDDTWALAYALRCPELDVRLVTTDRGLSEYRARLVCRLLEEAGRTDVPVGLGPEWDGYHGPLYQEPCAQGYELPTYSGTIHRDGVQAMIDVVMDAPEPVTVVSIGPVPTVREALDREPRISERAFFVGMHGSLRLGYAGDRGKVVAEANVKNDPAACRAVFTAPWPVTITPLDTCAMVRLDGERHRRVMTSTDPLARFVADNYRIWWQNRPDARSEPHRWQRQSSTLFDTVAVYLAYSEDLLQMEDLGVRVDDDGFTRLDPAARRIRCATGWKDLERFLDHLSARIAVAG